MHPRTTCRLLLLVVVLLLHACRGAVLAPDEQQSSGAAKPAAAERAEKAGGTPEAAARFQFGLLLPFSLGLPPPRPGPPLGLGALTSVVQAVGSVLGISVQVDVKEQPAQAQQKTPAATKQHKPPAATKQPAQHKTPAVPKQQPAQQHQPRPKQGHQKPKSKQPTVAGAAAQLPAVKPGHVPMCEWRADFASCQLHRHFFLAVPEAPRSFVAQTVTGAAARDYACSRLKDAAACHDASEALRCGWQLSGRVAFDTSGCRSHLMAEWSAFAAQISAGAGAAEAATGLGSFVCPGSPAAKALACNTAYSLDRKGAWAPRMCTAAGPGCVFQAATNSCVTSTQFTTQLAGLRPLDVGGCSAACYLRVLDSCPARPGATSSPAAMLVSQSSKTCWASRGCTWASSQCVPDIFSSKLDEWGRTVTKAGEACQAQNEPWSCAHAGARKQLRLPGAAVQAALSRPLVGPGMLDAQCAM